MLNMNLRSDEDFLYKQLGAALVNNRTEVDEIIDVLTNRGGGVRLVDNGRIYYNPGQHGSPGEIVMEEIVKRMEARKNEIYSG